ncbi:envelope stress response membrane protein PspB [Telmatospirillum siberiense]|uniref:Envelope stress response membrane protein PspB n=1 Tax=Telmatospirillum siberiense TaxID=382514 RepID=A0A2N3PYY9_9PROT|nr:envelope stress response membrane protein PspB [Telmatospirillum siberiense]PKU25571.1 envelope stress response membrane protein PspB [Telmatospirillum siberiense]
MMGWSGHMTGVLIVAIVVIGPIWLSLHYRARNAAGRMGRGDLSAKLDELTVLAGRMQARIEALERLLEAAQTKGKS